MSRLHGSSWRALALWGIVAALITVAFATAEGPKQEGRRPVIVEGRLGVTIYDDFENNQSRTIYEVRQIAADKGSEGRVWALGDVDGLADVAPGSMVRVTGHHDPASDRLSGRVQLLPPPDGSTESHNTTTSYNMIVMLLNYSDVDLDPTCIDPGPIYDKVFGVTDSVATYIHENSFHKVSLQGTVAGPFDLNLAQSSGCNENVIVSKANKAATLAGYNLSQYTHKYYVLPTTPGCGGGQGNVCGPLAWARGACDHHVFAHEWGHNLGLRHAAVPQNPSCNPLCDYGDTSSTMGNYIAIPPGMTTNLRHFNAPQKFELDWLPPAAIQTVTASGVYTVNLLEEDGGIQALVIPEAIESPYRDLVLSYRRQTGFDVNLPAQFEMKTSIHQYDMRPTTQCPFASTYLYGVIGDGESYTDPNLGVTILQISHSSVSATLQIQFGPCTDSDADGVCDVNDNCPTVANTNQLNSDSDAFGNACDNCPTVTNANQLDSDSDGVGNACDNCPSVANTNQLNSDSDTFGDACDNCPTVTNANQADLDGDGFGNVCDNCFDHWNPDQTDTDQDGQGDACEGLFELCDPYCQEEGFGCTFAYFGPGDCCAYTCGPVGTCQGPDPLPPDICH